MMIFWSFEVKLFVFHCLGPINKGHNICSGCKSCCIDKTDRTLHERTKEHAYAKANKNEQSTINEHLSLCTHCSHIADLFKIDTNSFNSNQFIVSQPDSLPPFRPIVSSVGTYNYNLAQYLGSLLSLHLPSEYSTKDSFTFIEEIKSVSVTDKSLILILYRVYL